MLRVKRMFQLSLRTKRGNLIEKKFIQRDRHACSEQAEGIPLRLAMKFNPVTLG
jgi:hypothetical protein